MHVTRKKPLFCSLYVGERVLLFHIGFYRNFKWNSFSTVVVLVYKHFQEYILQLFCAGINAVPRQTINANQMPLTRTDKTHQQVLSTRFRMHGKAFCV